MDVAIRRPASEEQAIGVARFVLPQPYLLFLGDVTEPGFAKTAFGLRDWAGERCVGEYALPGARVTPGLPKSRPQAAAARGARSMVIGVANAGGVIPATWFGALLEALEAGLDLVSGMHVRLASLPGLQIGGRQVRPPADRRAHAAGRHSRSRPGASARDAAADRRHRLRAGQEIHRARHRARPRGTRHRREFRATGQTGIMIAGEGMPIDAVVADFAAGAAEMLTPDAAARSLGRHRGAGLAVPSGLCRRLARPAARQPARSFRRLPRAGPHARARPCRNLRCRRSRRSSSRPSRSAAGPIRPSAAPGVSLNTSKLDAAEAQREIDERGQAAGVAGRRSDARRPGVRAPARCLPVSDAAAKRTVQRVPALPAARPRLQGGGDRRRLCDRARARRILPADRALGRHRRDGSSPR